MAVTFLHGVETIEIESGVRPVTEVKTAVIGLVGIAPTGPRNVCTLVKNDVDAAQFGKQLPGFDIPQSLDHIFAQNAGTVIVVNVFNEDDHLTAVTNEARTVTGGKLKLSAAPIGAVVVNKADNTASTYIKGTDYTLDEFGNFKVIAGRIPESTILHFNFSKLNAAAVVAADIIGTVGADGNRTGIKAFDLAFNLFGFRPKILIAPGRSDTKTIANELLTSAERLRAVAIIDSIEGADVQATIESRTDATDSFGTSLKRAVLVYPYLKAYDPSKEDGNADTDTNTDFPYSAFLAGVTAATDKLFGYWWSPSNKPINGVTGIERAISANFQDASTDANALNEAGIVTVYNAGASAYKTWGNRNASWPTNAAPDNFISVLRTFDMVHESLELAALQFADRPINQALIDDIRQSGNNFCNVLIGRGALTEGSKVIYDKAENPVSQLASGQVVFTIVKMAPPPAERITYKSVIDISLLRTLK